VRTRGQAQLPPRIGCGSLESRSTAGIAARIRLPLVRIIVGVLLVGGVASCAVLGAAIGTAAALQGAGYQDVHVDITTIAGTEGGGNVRVSYSGGPTGDDTRDSEHAERIVWTTLRYRFAMLVIVRASGNCADPVCVSQSHILARVTYSELAARFGPRPAGLERAGPASGISLPGWVIGVAIVVALGVMGAAAVVLTMLIRSRRPTSLFL
jgi:hypothetical protein